LGGVVNCCGGKVTIGWASNLKRRKDQEAETTGKGKFAKGLCRTRRSKKRKHHKMGEKATNEKVKPLNV